MVFASDIKTRWAADFGSLSDGVVEAAITEASQRMSVAAWGSRYDAGLALLAAHILQQDKQGSAAAPGPIVSRSLMGASVTYAAGIQHASELGSTSYGQRFLELAKLVFPSRVA